MENKETKYHI